MRLDEWQKHLESEFLDDDIEPAPPTEASTSITPPARSVSAPVARTADLGDDDWRIAVSPFRAPLVAAGSLLVTLVDTVPGAAHQTNTRECQESQGEDIRTRTRRRSRTVATDAEIVAPVPCSDSIVDRSRLISAAADALVYATGEEYEVAQSSYKREFNETRAELMERLLDPILSLEETARLLNVCPTTVRRYANSGALKSFRKPTGREPKSSTEEQRDTRQRRFRLSDVAQFAARRIHSEGEGTITGSMTSAGEDAAVAH